MDTNILILGGGLAAAAGGFIFQTFRLNNLRRHHLEKMATLEHSLRTMRVNLSITDYDKKAALERAERAEAAATVHRLHTISAASQAPRPHYDRPATIYQASPARTSHSREDEHTEFGPVSAMNWQMRQDDDDRRSCGSCGDSCSSDSSSSSDSGSSDSGSCSSSGD